MCIGAIIPFISSIHNVGEWWWWVNNSAFAMESPESDDYIVSTQHQSLNTTAFDGDGKQSFFILGEPNNDEHLIRIRHVFSYEFIATHSRQPQRHWHSLGSGSIRLIKCEDVVNVDNICLTRNGHKHDVWTILAKVIWTKITAVGCQTKRKTCGVDCQGQLLDTFGCWDSSSNKSIENFHRRLTWANYCYLISLFTSDQSLK